MSVINFSKFLLCLSISIFSLEVFSSTSGLTKTTGFELIGGDFSLVNHRGKAVTEKDYRGKYMMVFFGFTNCASVCPIGVQTMLGAIKKLDKVQRSQIVPILISVDPERDTVQKMEKYVDSYKQSLVGLTGSPEKLASVAKKYRAYFSKKSNGESGNYQMDHSSIIYLMDKKGRYLTHFSGSQGAESVSEILKELIN